MLVDDATTNFLDHLRQGDDAATRAGVGYQVHFVLRHNAAQLRTGVHNLRESKDVDLSTDETVIDVDVGGYHWTIRRNVHFTRKLIPG